MLTSHKYSPRRWEGIFQERSYLGMCWTIFLYWTCLMTIWKPAHFEPLLCSHSLATGRSTSLSYLWTYQYHSLCLILVLEETFPIRTFQILQSSCIAEGSLYKNHFVCNYDCLLLFCTAFPVLPYFFQYEEARAMDSTQSYYLNRELQAGTQKFFIFSLCVFLMTDSWHSSCPFNDYWVLSQHFQKTAFISSRLFFSALVI